MKKIVKVLLVLIILTSIFCATNNVMATPGATAGAGTGSGSSGVSPTNFTGDSTYDTNSIGTIGNQVIRIVSTIGSIAAVIVLVVLGIKYMMGSAEEKAEYKKTLLPYIIGAALVFAASSIATIIFNFTTNLG